jgi:hypothetical protein
MEILARRRTEGKWYNWRPLFIKFYILRKTISDSMLMLYWSTAHLY